MAHITVTQSQIDFVTDQLDNYGIPYENIVTDYSGRFMYGKECVGIVAPTPAAASAFVYWLAVVRFADEADTDPLTDDLQISAAELWNVMDDLAGSQAMDNMAMAYIFYWPNVSLEQKTGKDTNVG